MDELEALNGADEDRAVELLEPLIERAPQIANRVARHRPFPNPEKLCEAIRTELLKLDTTDQISLFRSHPELAPEDPLAMTWSSQVEQARLDLTSDSNEYRARLADLNARYARKFGFPFITALVRHKDIDSVLAEFETRLAGTQMQEIQQSIDQIYYVSSSRVQRAFGHNGADMSQNAKAAGQMDREHGNRTEKT